MLCLLSATGVIQVLAPTSSLIGPLILAPTGQKCPHGKPQMFLKPDPPCVGENFQTSLQLWLQYSVEWEGPEYGGPYAHFSPSMPWFRGVLSSSQASWDLSLGGAADMKAAPLWGLRILEPPVVLLLPSGEDGAGRGLSCTPPLTNGAFGVPAKPCTSIRRVSWCLSSWAKMSSPGKSG